jgi:hypothetical protein
VKWAKQSRCEQDELRNGLQRLGSRISADEQRGRSETCHAEYLELFEPTEEEVAMQRAIHASIWPKRGSKLADDSDTDLNPGANSSSSWEMPKTTVQDLDTDSNPVATSSSSWEMPKATARDDECNEFEPTEEELEPTEEELELQRAIQASIWPSFSGGTDSRLDGASSSSSGSTSCAPSIEPGYTRKAATVRDEEREPAALRIQALARAVEARRWFAELEMSEPQAAVIAACPPDVQVASLRIQALARTIAAKEEFAKISSEAVAAMVGSPDLVPTSQAGLAADLQVAALRIQTMARAMTAKEELSKLSSEALVVAEAEPQDVPTSPSKVLSGASRVSRPQHIGGA